MSPSLHRSLEPHSLQYESAALPIKNWNLFSHLLDLSWPCDLLWTIGCGGGEGVLVLCWGFQRLSLPLWAPLEARCHWVNGPVVTCWRMAGMWLSHGCNHCQRLDNHRIREWGRPRTSSPSSPPGDYTWATESSEMQLSLAQNSKISQLMIHS